MADVITIPNIETPCVKKFIQITKRNKNQILLMVSWERGHAARDSFNLDKM
jgi:hypothetical protein